MKDWVLKTDNGIDGDSLSYLDMMERNSAEERRRARERVIMDEGRTLWEQKKKEDLEMDFRDVEEVREMSKMKMFGRPGNGAPTIDIRKKRFTEHQMDESIHRTQPGWGDDDDLMSQSYPPPMSSSRMGRHGMDGDREEHMQDALTFGRPGYGAPVRTKSGRLRTAITGNPEIRFQANESVQKTISNNIRYAIDPKEKELYHKELEDQIRTRKEMEGMERDADTQIARQMEQTEGLQWGKAGPGGAYWRNSAVTGQGFFDKMGWCGSGDPRKRQYQVRHGEAEEMKKEMGEIQTKRDMEHDDINSDVGLELVPLMKNKMTGKPRKDPNTGYMQSHSLSTIDVTKMAGTAAGAESLYSKRNFPEEKRRYWDTLASQVTEKSDIFNRNHQLNEEQQKQHFQSWEGLWGRPGNGAPREHIQKENLMKMLHYPTGAKQTPNNVELITLERLPIK